MGTTTSFQTNHWTMVMFFSCRLLSTDLAITTIHVISMISTFSFGSFLGGSIHIRAT